MKKSIFDVFEVLCGFAPRSFPYKGEKLAEIDENIGSLYIRFSTYWILKEVIIPEFIVIFSVPYIFLVEPESMLKCELKSGHLL